MHSHRPETLTPSKEVNSVPFKIYPSESHCHMALDAQDGCNPVRATRDGPHYGGVTGGSGSPADIRTIRGAPGRSHRLS